MLPYDRFSSHRRLPDTLHVVRAVQLRVRPITPGTVEARCGRRVARASSFWRVEIVVEDTITVRLARWLRGEPEKCFCDQCLAQESGFEIAHVRKVVRSRSGSLSRYRGRCFVCGEVKIVTIATGSL